MEELDKWVEIAKQCNYLPENDLKVIQSQWFEIFVCDKNMLLANPN